MNRSRLAEISRLIVEKRYVEALEVAREQVENGAQINVAFLDTHVKSITISSTMSPGLPIELSVARS